MKARLLAGKTIKKLHQLRAGTNVGKVWTVDAIEFTDGTVLRFLVLEGEAEYAIEAIYPARGIQETR